MSIVKDFYREPELVVVDRDCDTDPLTRFACTAKSEAESVAPQATEIEKNYSIKIDWLEFTVQNVNAVDVIQGYLNLPFDDFTLETYTIQGFEALWSFGLVKVLESPSHKHSPVKVILSAQALDQVNRDSLDIIRVAHRDGATFRRIDVALDCKTELLDMETISSAILSGQAVHRFRRITPRQDLNANLEKITDSWTFGSSKGKRMLVIYNKQLERMDRGHDDPGPWIRIEGRWKSSTANIVAKTIIKQGLDAGYLLGILDFKEGNSVNKADWNRCTWWETFLAGCQPIKTGERKNPSTIKKKVIWVNDFLCKTLAQVFVSEGLEFIKSVIRTGIKKTDRKEWLRLFGSRMNEGYLSYMLALPE